MALQGVEIYDQTLGRGDVPLDKISLAHQDALPFPNSTIHFHFQPEDLERLKYPVILKDLENRMGRGVTLAESKQDAKRHLEMFGSKMVIEQEYLAIDHDYRVVVLNGKVLGVLARHAQEGDFLTTRPRGLRESVQLPEETLKKCVEAVRAKGLFFAGVDIAEVGGRYVTFEINSSPQINVFQKYTGINVARHFIDALLHDT